MQIIKECNLQALQAHYGTDLERLDSRVTGRNVLSGGTPGISPSYGEWIEFVINLTLDDLIHAGEATAAYSQAVTAVDEATAELIRSQTAMENAKATYQQAVLDGDQQDLKDLKDAYDQAVTAANKATEAYNLATGVLNGMSPYDKSCLLRFENPSPIKIFQVCHICEMKDGEILKGLVHSPIPATSLQITIKNDKRADGWYDCRVLLCADAGAEVLAHLEQPISIFLRFWRVYN